MKAIIHIGLPKCGSTSIQSWMNLNRVAMETRGVQMIGPEPVNLICAIIHVALRELGVDENSALHGLNKMKYWRQPRLVKKVEQLLGNPNEMYETLCDKLRKFSANPGFFVCSWEFLFFFLSSETRIIALDRYLSKFFDNRTYIIYIRDTVDLFLSWYSQKIKSNNKRYGTMELDLFLSNFSKKPHYFDKIFLWDRVIGEKLNVRLLEFDWLTGGNLIDDFSSLTGVGQLQQPPKKNQSLAAEYIEFARFMNRELSEMLPEEVRKRAIRILTKASSGKPKLSVSDSEADSIREIFGDKEEEIRKRFFPDRHFLFSPKFRGSGVKPAPLTETRREAIESELRQKMASRDWESYNRAATLTHTSP